DQASHLAQVVSVFKLGEQLRQAPPTAPAPRAPQPARPAAPNKHLAAAKPAAVAAAARAPAKAPAGDDWEEF
ncbi:MAG: methyl-accepting chemotaxis protein, partial [Janthinobacterium sp.]